MNLLVYMAVLVGLAATAEDLWHRRVSNWIPLSALLGGLLVHTARDGWHGTLVALAGAASGFGVFLVFYLLGGMGGGDVKLMAGFGALLGASRSLEAALWTAGIGGLLAAGAVGWNALRRRWGKALPAEKSAHRAESIPYAPAITAGVWLALIPKG